MSLVSRHGSYRGPLLSSSSFWTLFHGRMPLPLMDISSCSETLLWFRPSDLLSLSIGVIWCLFLLYTLPVLFGLSHGWVCSDLVTLSSHTHTLRDALGIQCCIHIFVQTFRRYFFTESWLLDMRTTTTFVKVV